MSNMVTSFNGYTSPYASNLYQASQNTNPYMQSPYLPVQQKLQAYDQMYPQYQQNQQAQQVQQIPAQQQPVAQPQAATQTVQSKLIFVSSLDEVKNQGIFDNAVYIFVNNTTGEIIATRQIDINTGASPITEYQKKQSLAASDQQSTNSSEQTNQEDQKTLSKLETELDEIWQEIGRLKGVITNVEFAGINTDDGSTESTSQTTNKSSYANAKSGTKHGRNIKQPVAEQPG